MPAKSMAARILVSATLMGGAEALFDWAYRSPSGDRAHPHMPSQKVYTI